MRPTRDPVRDSAREASSSPPTVMRQGAFAAVARIDRLDDLRVELETIQKQVFDGVVRSTQNALLPFGDLRTVHFARFVILEAFDPPLLLFATEYDEPTDAHLHELANVAGAGLERVLRCCVGFAPPADLRANYVVEYLERHAVPPACYYVGSPGRTLSEIQSEAALTVAVERALGNDPGPLSRDVRGELTRWLRGQTSFAWALEPPPPGRLPLGTKLSIALRTGVRLLPQVLLALACFPILRRLERRDAQAQLELERADGVAWDALWETTRSDTEALQRYEDYGPQNQLTAVTTIKPGFVRNLTLRAVLGAIDLLAHVWFDRGTLGGIRTIHFARWIIIEDKLIFLSNFDGSWESYLGEFVDRASIGLTAVWSNTIGFPPTKNLVQEGASNEQRFKQFARSAQVQTQVWYSAYPSTTLADVQRATAIRAGFSAPPDPEADRAWRRAL
jgi:hypothetical protein